MSSISGSERASRNDEVRKIKEEYEAKELQSSKKKKKEIENLKKAQSNELANVEKEYNENLGETRKASRQVLSERDRKNQQKIEEVRNVFREQLKNKSENSQSRESELKNSYENQISKQKEIHESQTENLKGNLTQQLNDQGQLFDSNLNETKVKSKEGLERKLDEIRNAHQKELAAVAGEKNEKVFKLTRALDDTKTNADLEKRSLIHKNELEKNRLGDKWKTAYVGQQESMDDTLALKSDEIKLSREMMKDDYENKLQNKLSSLDKARENLEKQSVERYEKQVRGMESVANRERELRLKGLNQNSKRLDMQRKNLGMYYEDRIDDLENQIKGTREQAKDISSKRIAKALDQNTEILQGLNQKYKSELRETQGRAREGFRTQDQFHRLQTQNLSDRQENRVNRLTQDFNQTQEKMSDVQKRQLSNMKETYIDTVGQLRDQQKEQLEGVFLTMDERANRTKTKLENKLNETALGYEKKLDQELSAKDKEIDLLTRKYETRLKDQSKGFEMESKTKDMKFEKKLALIEEAHEKDMEKLQRKHQEQMASVAQRFKSAKA